MGLTVKLWGIRGSLPAPPPLEYLEKLFVQAIQAFEGARASKPELQAAEFVKSRRDDLLGYGGHTSCFEVTSPNTTIFIDGGSGLRRAGTRLLAGPCGLGKGEVHIFMTHFHWDHLIGLPFFTPIFIPGNTIHFYAVHRDLEENIRRIFCKPNFPVPFENLGSAIKFHQLSPREPYKIGEMVVTPYLLDHPDECWGFKIESGGKAYAHCVDSESVRTSREAMGEDLPLYQNIDLMVFDAQYTFQDAAERINWGHGSGPIGIDIGLRERVKRMLFVHHDPAATNEDIREAEIETRNYFESLRTVAQKMNEPFHTLEWSFAREGMVIEV